MSTIILRLSVLSAGIFLAEYLIPGIHTTGYGPIIEAAVLLGVLNLIIKPVLFILTLPINILSLGLFTFFINGFLLWFVSVFIDGFQVAGFGVAILGAIVISIFSIVVNRLIL